MSKNLPPLVLAKYTAPTATLARFALFSRLDGFELGLTSCDMSISHGGHTYLADPGLVVTNLNATAGLAVDNLEVRLLPDDDLITQADILAGRWNQCSVQIFEADPQEMAAGINILLQASTGEFQLDRGSFRAELRGIEQLLGAAVGWVTQKTCRYRLGSNSWRDGFCKVDLVPFTHAGTFTSIPSRTQLVASADAQVADYYTEGELRITSGLASGLRFKVKQHAAGGVFTLAAPAVIVPAVGDTFEAVAGCQKRLEPDCRDKFDNVLNFGGEPHGTGMDFLTKPVDASS